MNTETKQPNGAENRPGALARSVGAKKRRRFNDALSATASALLGHNEFRKALSAVKTTIPNWVIVRLRPEVMATVKKLQQKHLDTTGKEISKPEVIAALALAGLPHVLNHQDFTTE